MKEYNKKACRYRICVKVSWWENLTQDWYLQAFLLWSFTSNGDYLNILPMGLFHYNMWDFSKGFHIFVRGVSLFPAKTVQGATPLPSMYKWTPCINTPRQP